MDDKVENMYYMHEIAKHNNEKDCWVIINNNVYDLTKFINEHPGGRNVILKFAGKDATEEFEIIHQNDVIEKYLSKEEYKGGVMGTPLQFESIISKI